MASSDGKGVLMRWAWRQSYVHPHLSSSAVLVLLSIVDRWSPGSEAWPSHADIQGRTHLSERQLTRCVSELSLRDILRREPRVTGLGSQRGWIYWPTCDVEEERLREGEENAASVEYGADERRAVSDEFIAKERARARQCLVEKINAMSSREKNIEIDWRSGSNEQ